MIPGRDQLKRLWFTAFDALHADALVLRHVARHDLVVVVNLHQVSPTPNPFWSPLHPVLFGELVDFVAPRFRVTTFGRLAEAAGDPRPALVLSFDDGYHDYVEYALPALDARGLPSNQNVIVDCVRSGEPPAIVRLCDFLVQAPRSLVDEIRLPGAEGLRLAGDSTGDKTRYGVALCNFVKLRSREDAAPLWAELERVMARFDGLRPTRMMTLADVRGAAREHEIGCHSKQHDSMEFESDAWFEADLDACAAFFRDELQQPLGVYAFPNGSARRSLLDILFRRGVRHVLLVGEDYSTRTSRIHPRFTFGASSSPELRARAVGFRGYLRAFTQPRPRGDRAVLEALS